MAIGMPVSGTRVTGSNGAEPNIRGWTTLMRIASLSFEKDSINRSPVYLSGENADLIGLLNALGGGVLRISANSVDETTWTPGGSGQTSGQVAPIDVQNFASLIRKCPNWSVIYGVNFLGEDGSAASPALAASEAAYAAEQLGRQLLGFEIGNEPDLYGNGLTYDIFLNGGRSPTAPNSPVGTRTPRPFEPLCLMRFSPDRQLRATAKDGLKILPLVKPARSRF